MYIRLIGLLLSAFFIISCGAGSSSSQSETGSTTLGDTTTGSYSLSKPGQCSQVFSSNTDSTQNLLQQGYSKSECQTNDYLSRCMYSHELASYEGGGDIFHYAEWDYYQNEYDALLSQVKSECNSLKGILITADYTPLPTPEPAVSVIESNSYQNFFLQEKSDSIIYSFHGESGGHLFPNSQIAIPVDQTPYDKDAQTYRVFDVTNQEGTRTLQLANMSTGVTRQISNSNWSPLHCFGIKEGIIAIWEKPDLNQSCNTLATDKSQFLMKVFTNTNTSPQESSHGFAYVTPGILDEYLKVIKLDDKIYGFIAFKSTGSYSVNYFYPAYSDKAVTLNFGNVEQGTILKHRILIVSENEILIHHGGRLYVFSVQDLDEGNKGANISTQFNYAETILISTPINLDGIDYIAVQGMIHLHISGYTLYKINGDRTYTPVVNAGGGLSFSKDWFKFGDEFLLYNKDILNDTFSIRYFNSQTGKENKEKAYTGEFNEFPRAYRLQNKLLISTKNSYYFAGKDGVVKLTDPAINRSNLILLKNIDTNNKDDQTILSIDRHANTTWIYQLNFSDNGVSRTPINMVKSPFNVTEGRDDNYLYHGLISEKEIHFKIVYRHYAGALSTQNINKIGEDILL
ncbi:MAG: hypothetical protein V7765_03755 [Oleispira sp.]